MLFPSSKCLLTAFLAVLAVIGVSVWIGEVQRAEALLDAGPSESVQSVADPSVTEWTLFYEPTPPVPVTRMLTESVPAAAVVVALPESQVLGNPHKEAFFLRLIEVAARYVKVVILVNRDEPLAITRICNLIRRQVKEPDAVLEQVTFQRSVIDSEWVRDYGPLFGVGIDGGPVLVDNMYRDIRSEAATERMLTDIGFVKTDGQPPARVGAYSNGNAPYLSDYGHFWRRNDDAAPLYFNEILYIQQGRYGALVRPPLQLSGGDVMFAESGIMFTSTRSLELNGGDGRKFSRLAEDYFNAEVVHYLRPLPRGMWHIDMFMRIASPRSVMLGQFPEAGTADADDLGRLRREAGEALEWNCALIEQRLPSVEVIRVPMPPIVPVESGKLDQMGETGIADLDSAIDANGLRLKPLSAVLYRSYLNSLFINGGDNPSAVIVPRFTGMEATESKVERAYRRAYPDAEVHFINADVMVEEFGGIHCVTVTIPDFDRCVNIVTP